MAHGWRHYRVILSHSFTVSFPQRLILILTAGQQPSQDSAACVKGLENPQPFFMVRSPKTLPAQIGLFLNCPYPLSSALGKIFSPYCSSPLPSTPWSVFP